jgi:hypothetical protein
MGNRLFAPRGGDSETRDRELGHSRKWVSDKGGCDLPESEPKENCGGIFLHWVVLQGSLGLIATVDIDFSVSLTHGSRGLKQSVFAGCFGRKTATSSLMSD